MTKIEIMDAMASMDSEGQRYAHKLLCREFAGRRIYTAERLPKLVDMIRGRVGDNSKIKKELMVRFNDRELVSEIMDVYAPEKSLVPTNIVYNVLGSIDGCVSVDWLIDNGAGLSDYGFNAVYDALSELCLDGLVECDSSGDDLTWRIK